MRNFFGSPRPGLMPVRPTLMLFWQSVSRRSCRARSPVGAPRFCNKTNTPPPPLSVPTPKSLEFRGKSIGCFSRRGPRRTGGRSAHILDLGTLVAGLLKIGQIANGGVPPTDETVDCCGNIRTGALAHVGFRVKLWQSLTGTCSDRGDRAYEYNITTSVPADCRKSGNYRWNSERRGGWL